ncbi:hypothetical protein GW17_00052232 [Ensete ventricosum]|nr:hypothetical protein GW17_00052232 [Ensete ventricosum]
MEATTNNNIELLLPNRVSYIRNLSYASNKLKNLQSYLKWMCVNQFDAMHAMVFLSLFILCVFVLTTLYFVLSYAPTHRAYNVVV